MPDDGLLVVGRREPRVRHDDAPVRVHVAGRRRSTDVDYDLDDPDRDAGEATSRSRATTRSAFETRRVWATAPDGTGCRSRSCTAATSRATGQRRCCSTATARTRSRSTRRSRRHASACSTAGVVFAIAHVRGGGELGRRWYEDGKLDRKRNTFTDFIACAEHLVAEGYTRPDRLAARGGSAGGLLMGAVANLAPNSSARSSPRCRSSTASPRSSTRRSRSPSPSGRSGATRSTTRRSTTT